jgi:EAL domain-containing protein (putative c-di-GMP-specific phosphodiesterase class I)
MDKDRKADRLVRTLTTLAHALGLTTVAEGIEMQAQYEEAVARRVRFRPGLPFRAIDRAADLDRASAGEGNGYEVGEGSLVHPAPPAVCPEHNPVAVRPGSCRKCSDVTLLLTLSRQASVRIAEVAFC